MKSVVTVVVLVLLAGVAIAARWSVNPSGTEAVVDGKLYVTALGTDSACLNLEILDDHPTSPEEGDFYCEKNTYTCCMFKDGAKRCIGTVVVP